MVISIRLTTSYNVICHPLINLYRSQNFLLALFRNSVQLFSLFLFLFNELRHIVHSTSAHVGSMWVPCGTLLPVIFVSSDQSFRLLTSNHHPWHGDWGSPCRASKPRKPQGLWEWGSLSLGAISGHAYRVKPSAPGLACHMLWCHTNSEERACVVLANWILCSLHCLHSVYSMYSHSPSVSTFVL
jgi:hypothetical protein